MTQKVGKILIDVSLSSWILKDVVLILVRYGITHRSRIFVHIKRVFGLAFANPNVECRSVPQEAF